MKKASLALAFLALASSAAFAQDDKPARGEMRGPGSDHLQRADTDSSGDISFEEFAAAIDRRSALVDADGDGRLTVEEIAAEIERMRNRRMAERIIARFDGDGDKVLTKEEIESRQRKMFALMDRNDDGKIERSEMPRRMTRDRRHR